MIRSAADRCTRRLIERGAMMVGLGVSLNTNSFIHVIDSRLSAHYPRPAYDGRFAVEVVDEHGVVSTVSRRALQPDFQRLTAAFRRRCGHCRFADLRVAHDQRRELLSMSLAAMVGVV